jgi:hypothetical protein
VVIEKKIDPGASYTGAVNILPITLVITFTDSIFPTDPLACAVDSSPFTVGSGTVTCNLNNRLLKLTASGYDSTTMTTGTQSAFKFRITDLILPTALADTTLSYSLLMTENGIEKLNVASSTTPICDRIYPTSTANTVVLDTTIKPDITIPSITAITYIEIPNPVPVTTATCSVL